MIDLTFDYYYGVQAEQFAFYRIPRLLIKDEHFKDLPESVKFILFCNQLSKQNWLSITLIAVFFQFPH